MQNQLDDGTVIYNESIDSSGFVIREILKTSNPAMRFQAGRYAHRPMRLPVYRGPVVSHHIDGDDMQYFYLHGYGRTKSEALDRAANSLILADIERNRTTQLAHS
jgi:hypothetical protein